MKLFYAGGGKVIRESEIYSLKEMLLKSHWPKCNEIAEKLYEIGTDEAKIALIEGLKGIHYEY